MINIYVAFMQVNNFIQEYVSTGVVMAVTSWTCFEGTAKWAPSAALSKAYAAQFGAVLTASAHYSSGDTLGNLLKARLFICH